MRLFALPSGASEFREREFQFLLGRARHLTQVVIAATLCQVNLSFDGLKRAPRSDLGTLEPLQTFFSGKTAHVA